MNVWITDEPFPASPEVEVEAAAAGADQILHGIPPRWVDVIPPGTLGVFELPDPEPYTPEPSPVEVVRAEMLTAYEAEMAAGTCSLARLDAAIRAALGAT